MVFPDAPNPSDLPGLSNFTGPLSFLVGGVGHAAETFGGKLSELTGIGGAVGKIEDSIDRIRNFTNQQIDALVNGAASSARATEAFVTETLHRAQSQVGSALDQVLESANVLRMDLTNIPERASALVDDALLLKAKALARRDSIRKQSQRFRNRKQQVRKIALKEIEVLFDELETELELDALMAEHLGQSIERDSRAFYDQTVATAQLHSLVLMGQAEQAHQRSKQLKAEISGGISSAEMWAAQQVQKVGRFRSDRSKSAQSIASPVDAARWATDSIESAHRLAGEIRDDVARKPGEVMSFGRTRVAEAMQIAEGVRQGIRTANQWALTQKGLNARWKQQMRGNWQIATGFLNDQAERVAAKVETRGLAIEQKVRDVGQSQVEYVSGEVDATIGDIRETVTETKRSLFFDRSNVSRDPPEELINIEAELGQAPIKKFTAPKPNQKEPEAEVPPPQTEPPKQAKREEKPEVAHQRAPELGKELPIAKPKPKLVSDLGPPKANTSSPEPSPRLIVEEGSSTISKSISAEPRIPPSSANNGQPPSYQPKSVEMPSQEQADKPKSPKKNSAPPVDSKVTAGKSVAALPNPKQASLKTGASAVPTTKPTPSVTAPKAPTESSKPSTDKPHVSKTVAKNPLLSRPSAEVRPSNTHAKLPPRPEKLEQTVSAETTPRNPSPSPGLVDPLMFQAKLLQAGGAGEAPDPTTRSELMKHVGFDPSMMRIHTGPVAQAAASALNADAFTIGPNVFFGVGKFDPRSAKGLGLIGHEATHVGQQLGLRGDKMRFATASGGDAMEQEAQAVGERIASNIALGPMLKIQRFVKIYEPSDDMALSSGVQARLDLLGARALERASIILKEKGHYRRARLDEVQVDLELDLATQSDGESIQIWADKIVEAIVFATQEALPNARRLSSEISDSVAIQRSPLSAVPKGLGIKDAALNFADLRSGIPKLNEDEKETVRNLNARTDLDRLKISSSDPKYQQILASHNIHSVADYEKQSKSLVEFFTKKGLDTTKNILDTNEAVIDKEIMHYFEPGKPKPGVAMDELILAAQDLMSLYLQFSAEYNYRIILENEGRSFRNTKHKYPVLTTKNMHLISRLFRDTLFSNDSLAALVPKWQKWSFARSKHGKRFPILLGTMDIADIALPESKEALLEAFLQHLWATKHDIISVKKKLDSDKFWELGEMVAATKRGLGIISGEGADAILKEYAKDKAEDKAVWEMIKAGIAVALSIAATVATGGLAAGLAAGAFAMGAASAMNSLEDYTFQVQASNTAIEEANRISHSDPSLFWLVIDFLGAGMDFLDAAKAFQAISAASKAARTEAKLGKAEAKSIEELHDEAVATYRKYKDYTQLSEEEFVARIFRSANRGVKVTDNFAAQGRVIAELLQGTSRRVANVYHGDLKAMKQFVSEHGNWEGLAAALKSAGPEGEALLAKLNGVRQEVVDQCAAIGIKPRGDAGTGPHSDLDFSSFADEFGDAGEKIIKIEAELEKEFGADFKKALQIDFFAEGGQLLAYEQALKHLSPVQEASMVLRISKRTQMLNMARSVRDAGSDAKALKRIKDQLANSSMREMPIEKLKELGDQIHSVSRNDRLLELDKLSAELKTLKPGSPRYNILSEKITMKQMEVNFLMPGAYIGPANLKKAANFADAHQIASSQLEMIEHVFQTYDGDILRAVRNYEFHKYVSRFAEAAKEAGFSNKALEDFSSLSTLIYKDKSMRSALDFTGQYPGVTPHSPMIPSEINAKYIQDKYNAWEQIVNETMPKLEDAMRKKPTAALPGSDTPKNVPPTSGAGGSGPPPKPPGSEAATTPLPTRQQKRQASKIELPDGSDAGVYQMSQVKTILEKSEEGKRALAIQKKYKVTIKDQVSLKPGSGVSYFDPDVGPGGQIVIAPGKNSQEAALLYIHEMGHAEKYHQGKSAFNDAAILQEPNPEKWLRQLAEEEIESEIRAINAQWQLEPAGFSASSPLATTYYDKYMERLTELQSRPMKPPVPIETLQGQARQTAASYLKKQLQDGKVKSSAEASPAMRDMYLVHYYRIRSAAGL